MSDGGRTVLTRYLRRLWRRVSGRGSRSGRSDSDPHQQEDVCQPDLEKYRQRWSTQPRDEGVGTSGNTERTLFIGYDPAEYDRAEIEEIADVLNENLGTEYVLLPNELDLLDAEGVKELVDTLVEEVRR